MTAIAALWAQRTTRYALVGMAALSLLSFVHWLRDRRPELGRVGDYLIGVAPNFAAAIAISFILLSIWADRNRDAGFASARRWFFGCAAISGLGLAGWEVVQQSSRSLFYDPHDLLATLAGILVATLLFHAITPQTDDPYLNRSDAA